MIPEVFLSGWAMPATVFESLTPFFSFQALSLFGISQNTTVTNKENLSFDALTTTMSYLLPEKPVALSGWSLGGLLAIKYAARFPERVERLTLLSCNPCFVERSNWPYAMSSLLFDQFMQEIRYNPKKTLEKFYFLCVQGANTNRALFRSIRMLIESITKTEHTFLLPLLKLLSSDLRADLEKITCPVTHILSQNDQLIPVVLSESMKKKYPDHDVITVEGSHLFFYEYPEAIAKLYARSVAF